MNNIACLKMKNGLSLQTPTDPESIRIASEHLQIYKTQRKSGKVSLLSKTFNHWMHHTSELPSPSKEKALEFHYLLQGLEVKIKKITKQHNEPDTAKDIERIFAILKKKKFSFLELKTCQFINTLLSLIVVVNHSTAHLCDQDQPYKSRIGKLCHLFYHLYAARADPRYQNMAAFIMAHYYLWFEGKEQEAYYLWRTSAFVDDVYVIHGVSSMREMEQRERILHHGMADFYIMNQDKIWRYRKYLMDRKYYNLLINIIKIRECNYWKCKKRNMKRYKICKQCKSAFYCCRLHQKLDWNKGNHKRFCTKRQTRDYTPFPQLHIDCDSFSECCVAKNLFSTCDR